MPLTVGVQVPPRDRVELMRWTRSSSIPAGLAQRARIVLLAAEGMQNVDIAARVGVCVDVASRWRKRFCEEGIAGLRRPKPDMAGAVDHGASASRLGRIAVDIHGADRLRRQGSGSRRLLGAEIEIADFSVIIDGGAHALGTSDRPMIWLLAARNEQSRDTQSQHGQTA